MQKSRFHVLVSFAVVAVAGVSVSSSSAHAASSTTCTGSTTVSNSPGLTNTPQTVTWSSAQTYSCTSTDTSLTAGDATVQPHAESGLSCTHAFAALPTDNVSFEYTFYWGNSQSSTVIFTSGTDVLILGTEEVTFVGTVTSGEFTGADVTFVSIYPLLNPLVCATSQGYTSESGTVTVEIIGL